MWRKEQKQRIDVVSLSKMCTIANEGPFAVYEKKPQWKYRRLKHESYEWKLRQKYKEICGGTDLMLRKEDISEMIYVVHAIVKIGSKKEQILREEGFM